MDSLFCFFLFFTEGSGGGGKPGEKVLRRTLLPQQQAKRTWPCEKGQPMVPNLPSLLYITAYSSCILPYLLPPPPLRHKGQLSGSPCPRWLTDTPPVHPFIAARFSSLACQKIHPYGSWKAFLFTSPTTAHTYTLAAPRADTWWSLVHMYACIYYLY